MLPWGPEGGRWPLLGLSGPGWAQAPALPGTRRGPHEGQVPERSCASLYNGPGRRATPTSRTWGPGLSNGLFQLRPSSPGRTEREATKVLSLLPTQHCILGGPAPPCIWRQAPAGPQVTHIYRVPSWLSRADPELSAKAHPAQDPGHSRRQDLIASAQPVCPGPPAQGRLTTAHGQPGEPSSPVAAATPQGTCCGYLLEQKHQTRPRTGGSRLGASGGSAELRSLHLVHKPAGSWAGRREARRPAEPRALHSRKPGPSCRQPRPMRPH